MNARFQKLALVVALLVPSLNVARAQAPRTLLEHYSPSFGLLRDTILVLDSTFLEVRLNEQAIYHHYRSGRIARYTCSSGNPTIKDGIATREGIYAIQWKAKKHMSQLFQCYLNYWMPFDGGIGFHGLDGHSYYRYLGRRPSSHGCVRVANETGQKIFRDAPRGTVVWVHYGSPARVVRFGDTLTERITVMQSIDADLLAARLDAVVQSRALDSTLTLRLALRPGRPFSSRIAVGRVDRRHRSHWPLPLVSTATPSIATRVEKPAAARALAGPAIEISLLNDD